MKEIIFSWIIRYNYFGIYFLLMFGIIGLPIPDETLLAFVGYLCYQGKINLFISAIVSFLGSISGITVSYCLGRFIGLPFIEKYGNYVRISIDKIEKVHLWFDRIGKWTLVIGYYLPGIRHITAYVAGTAKINFHIFSFYAYFGGLIWSLTFITLGYKLGKNWSYVLKIIHHNLLLLTFGSLIILILFWVIGDRLKVKSER